MRRVSMSLAVLIVALLATARAGHASMEIPADDPPGGGCNSGSVPLELRSPTPTAKNWIWSSWAVRIFRWQNSNNLRRWCRENINTRM